MDIVVMSANLLRDRHCSDEVIDLISAAMKIKDENLTLKREIVDLSIELTRLKAENEFLLRTLATHEDSE